MKRSSSTSRQGIRFPCKYKKVFDQEKYKILQRIKSMIENNSRPISLLLVSPKQIEQANLPFKKPLMQSRKTINLKLLESDKKHKQYQDVAAAMHQCYNYTMGQVAIKAKIMDTLTEAQTVFKSGQIHSKQIAEVAIDRIKRKFFQNRVFEVSNTRNQVQFQELTMHTKLLSNYPNNIYRTFTPGDIQSTLSHSPAKFSNSSFKTRPPTTIQRKLSVNRELIKSQTNLRRLSMPKIGRPNGNHRGSYLVSGDKNIDMFNTDRSSMPFKLRLQQVLEDMPVSAWGNEEKA